jgi:Tol biopolymer transport system component
MSVVGFRLSRSNWVGSSVGFVVVIGVCASNVEWAKPWLTGASASQASVDLAEALTSDTPGGPVVDAAVSPDGTFIAFTDRSHELAIRDLSTGVTRVLTKRPSSDVNYDYFAGNPIPSPDSLKVAYVWGSELRVVAARGGASTVVFGDTQQRELGLALSGWFPDGKSLLVSISDSPNPRQLVRVTLADGARQLLRNNWSGEQCRVSPDGRHILFERRRPGSQNRALFVMSSNGSGELPLADDPAANNVALDWFPDGKRVLYVRSRANSHDALALSIENGRPSGRPTMIRRNVGWVRAHGVARDGRWYISRALSWPSVYVADLDAQSGKAINAPTPVPGHPWVVHSLRVSWSPGGDRLAYTDGWPNQDAGVVVQWLPGGTSERHAMSLSQLDRVAWSPDGRSVVVEGVTANRQAGLFRLDLTTKNASPQLLVAGANPYYPMFSPDGRTLFYRLTGPQGALGVFKRDLESGSEEVIPAQGGVAGTYLSPDGQTFLLLQRRRRTDPLTTIDTMPVDGGTQRTLIAGVDDSGAVAGWSHDSKSVLFRSGDSILRVSSSGGVAEPIGLSLPRIRSLSVHPNGRKIALTGDEVTFVVEVWQFDRSGTR